MELYSRLSLVPTIWEASSYGFISNLTHLDPWQDDRGSPDEFPNNFFFALRWNLCDKKKIWREFPPSAAVGSLLIYLGILSAFLKLQFRGFVKFKAFTDQINVTVLHSSRWGRETEQNKTALLSRFFISLLRDFSN